MVRLADLELAAFIGFVLVISLSGVLFPGPLTAATVIRSYSDKWAGAKVSVGHAIVEFPLFLLVAAGSATFFQQNEMLIAIIGIVGGAYLLFFGVKLWRDKDSFDEEKSESKVTGSAVVLGATLTLFNPAFILWWATIGLVVVMDALTFGTAILLAIYFIHWMVDFVWGIGISFGIQKAKQYYASQMKKVIRFVCAALILIFGIYFLATSLLTIAA
jgi:threonine/homoserine/homoserine lactone efflux protein